MSNATNTNPPASARVCAKGGCGREANGIAPFHYCAPHYVDYMGWLSRRALLDDAIAYAEAEELKRQLEDAGVEGVDFAVGLPAIRERVDRVLDLIGQVSADAIYECGAVA